MQIRPEFNLGPHHIPGPVRGFIGWLVLTFAAAGLGALATTDASSFYAQLAKPSWAPPGSVFGPVWSALYLLMAISAWLVWRKRGFASAPRTLALFIVQLVANAAWSWLFFNWKLGAYAFAEVLVLWLLVAATTIAFRRVRPMAGALMLPYLAWVTFACALTFATWRLNPHLLG
ncbi:MAG: TspO/MBR family protein [Pseudomonadota bacterium]